IDRARPHEIARRGIGRTFQNVRPFPALTVEENVIIGALGNASGLGDALERAHQPIWRLDLFERLNRPASSLSLSERRRLELARALAMRPNLLLLDEILAGLRPAEVDQMLASLREFNRANGAAIMLAERTLRAAALVSRVVMLHHGIAIADGAPEAVIRGPAVIASRLAAGAPRWCAAGRSIWSAAPRKGSEGSRSSLVKGRDVRSRAARAPASPR